MQKSKNNLRMRIVICAAMFTFLAFSQSANAQNWLTAGNSGSGYKLGTTSADSFSIWANDTARIWVKKNGRVGIGTSATGQGYLLSVNGNVRAREVVVNTSTWSDFVFSKDYKLPDLKTLEKQIKEQKHLPGVPSAEDVQKNGVPVGEMDKILLQKVEELTLYIIELQKQVDQLKAKSANQ